MWPGRLRSARPALRPILPLFWRPPKASSETADPQEALAELRAGGYRLWSTIPAPAHGRSETYVGAPDGRGGRYETAYRCFVFTCVVFPDGRAWGARRFCHCKACPLLCHVVSARFGLGV